MIYSIKPATAHPSLQGLWEEDAWAPAETLLVSNFLPQSSDHRPDTAVKILHSNDCLHGIFRVEDRHVRSVHTEFNSPVCTDSCVEFFVQPKAGQGYFSFEFNCGGTLLADHIRDHRRTADGFRDYTPLRASDAEKIQIYHSMPRVVDPEIQTPVTWIIEFAIPISLLEKYVGGLGNLPGQRWKGNFYKCGDHTSHPHWAAWSAVDALNFHLPECFGTLVLV